VDKHVTALLLIHTV